jgi:hypothetical protein
MQLKATGRLIQGHNKKRKGMGMALQTKAGVRANGLVRKRGGRAQPRAVGVIEVAKTTRMMMRRRRRMTRRRVRKGVRAMCSA